MSHKLLELARKRAVIFDGAMGTMLMAAGLKAGETPERWNVERPDLIREIHRRYYEAGSDSVHTNTFGGTRIKLADIGLGDQMGLLNRAAAENARAVCPPGKFVAGDLGPTGKMLQPLGALSVEQAEAGFRDQAGELLAGGVDFISIETMISLEESLAAVRGAKTAGATMIVAATTYQKTPNGFFTMMGESVPQCASALEAAGAGVIAANCTLGSGDMVALTRELRAATEKPILIQPNAGKPVLKAGVTHFEQSPDAFARDILEIRNAGADMVGGCCGTTADFIRAVAAILAA